MDKESGVYVHRGVLLGHTEESSHVCSEWAATEDHHTELRKSHVFSVKFSRDDWIRRRRLWDMEGMCSECLIYFHRIG